MRGRAFLLAIAVPAGRVYRGAKLSSAKCRAPAVVPRQRPCDQRGSLADARWFEVFKDQELQSLIHTALERNYDVREAAARVEAGRPRSAFPCGSVPTVAVSADVTSQRYPGVAPFRCPRASSRTGFSSVASNLLSSEVDAWGRLRRATEAARATLLASEDNRRLWS